MIRFHLDENAHGALAAALRARGIDVTSARENDLLSEEDDVQLEFAHREGRVVFTQDDDFLKRHAAGVEHAGIVYCHPQSHSVGEIVHILVLIHACMTADEMRGHVEFV